MSVLPITSAHLRHHTSSETVPTGILGLDDMLGAGGIIKAPAFISGASGSRKDNLCFAFRGGDLFRGERCVYFAFENRLGKSFATFDLSKSIYKST